MELITLETRKCSTCSHRKPLADFDKDYKTCRACIAKVRASRKTKGPRAQLKSYPIAPAPVTVNNLAPAVATPQLVAVAGYVFPLVGPTFDLSRSGKATVILPVQETRLEPHPSEKEANGTARKILMHSPVSFSFEGDEARQLRAALAPYTAQGDPSKARELDEAMAEWEKAEQRATAAEARATDLQAELDSLKKRLSALLGA